jgi:hypothetical protein
MTPGRGERRTGWATCLLLAAWMGAEFLLFDRIGAHWHTGIYPRWNDQIQYLTEAYTGYEYLLAHGFWAGMWQTLTHPAAQGTLDDCYAVLLFRVAGPSRSAALAVNMLAFLAWQGALFFAVARGTGSRRLAWVSTGLLLSLCGPWSATSGSAVDFRLDHLAMCTLGVALAAALLTDRFRATGWSLAFGVASGVTLSTRFLTGPYFILLLGFGVAWTATAPQRRRRLRNLALAALVAFALAAPLVWLNRIWVYNYYWIGHFFGPESAIRNPHLNLTQSLVFVAGHLSSDHLGPVFWILAGTLSLALAIPSLGRRRPESVPAATDWPAQAAALGAAFLLAPGLVLTLHNQKSPIVESIMAPGLVVLVLAAGAFFLARVHPRLTERAVARLTAALAALALTVGGGYFFVRQVQRPLSTQFIADARKVNALADAIFQSSRAAGLAAPRVGVDEVTDCLDGQVLRVICYERHRVWVPFVMTLPTGIGEEKESVLFEHLAQSDFVFLTEAGPVGGWPYDREMHTLLPKTWAWCDAHLHPVDHFTLFGQRMVLYQRHEIPLP